MTARLDPATALAYLRSLSTDLRAAAVLGASGEVLAGDPAMAGAAGPGVLTVEDGGRAIVVEPGSHAAQRLLLIDMRTTLEALNQA